jgi:hypothetical protein
MDTKPSAHFAFAGFEGFGAPNTTPVPDVVFDVLAPELSEAELRVLLYIIRRTFGFKKTADSISLRQMVDGIVKRDGTILDRGTGLTKSGVTKALKGLVAKGLIVARQNRSAERGNEPTTYTLRFKTPLSMGEDKGVSTGVDNPLSTGVDTQQTVLQQTVLQSNSSMDDKEKKFDHEKDIKVERTASESITVKHVPATEPPPVADVPRQTRPQSEVTPIGNVLKWRAEVLGQANSSPRVVRSSSTMSAPTEQGPLGPSPGRQAATAPVDRRESVLQQQEPSGAAGRSTARHSRRRVRPPLQIEAIITQFSHEFHDDEHVEVNISHAARLWQASGRSEQTFCQLLFDAASATRKRGGVRNRMAYYFRVLRDLLGLARQPN